ncbi:MAG: hypothetical protein QXL96_12490, partial [Ignisphaera sp.]
RQRKDQAPPRKRSLCADHSRRITSPNINLYKTRNSCARQLRRYCFPIHIPIEGDDLRYLYTD